MTYYQPKHFKIQELVPPSTYKELGGQALLVMDYYLLKTIDSIREWFDQPVIINNWLWGGSRKYSGFRPCGCNVGAKYSQHRYGRACDLLVRGMSAEDVRRQIIANSTHFIHVSCVEGGVEWVHIDCRAITDGPVVF